MKIPRNTNGKVASLEERSMLSFEYDDLVIRFKRAKSEETLEVMYKGALNKVEKLLTGKALVMAQIAIERALDRCQQDFDNTHLGLTRKINHTLKTQDSAKKYNPEEEMSRLLSGIG